jgi:hypothetical protein
MRELSNKTFKVACATTGANVVAGLTFSIEWGSKERQFTVKSGISDCNIL